MSTALKAETPVVLKVLGHDLRWRMAQHLARGDLRVGELVELVGEKQNLVSYHLKLMRQASMVVERRSSRDARDIYYSLDLPVMEKALDRSAQALHPALRTVAGAAPDDPGLPQARRVLFLCTGNSARSQMAEAILRKLSGGAVEVLSAGSRPRAVNRMAIRVLDGLGYSSQGLRSKPINEFIDDHFDWIITLCDNVREECPAFPGDPERVHWSFADPAAAEGSDEQIHAAFLKTATELASRIRYLLSTLGHAER
jgi:protein-tyrosine-phosphatase/DNA-binding transcriptional ArsR family regulator